MFILEAKLGMSDSYTIIGEFDNFHDALVAKQEYEYNQFKGDLYADSNIVKLQDLLD